MMQEACNFVKRSCRELTRYLTKQHASVVDQYLTYKKMTRSKIHENTKLKEQVYEAESLNALKFPLYEAYYAIDDRTALTKYDCLVPRVNGHFRINKDLLPFGYAEDKDTKFEIVAKELQLVSEQRHTSYFM